MKENGAEENGWEGMEGHTYYRTYRPTFLPFISRGCSRFITFHIL